MKKIVFYDSSKTYIFPNGVIATPQKIREQYPATEFTTYVMETDDSESVILSMDMLSMLRKIYDIDSDLDEEEALQAIQDVINERDQAVQEINDETRIADALEDLVVLNMPDIEEE